MSVPFRVRARRGAAGRGRHRAIRIGGLVVLVTLPAFGLPSVPAAAEPAAKGLRSVEAQDLPALRSPAGRAAKLDMPAGDFGNAPPSPGRDEPDGVVPDRSGLKAGATLVGGDAAGEIWDNHDGTSTAVVHARHSVWRDRSGQDRPVDGRLVRKGSRLASTAGPVGFDLPGSSGAGELVTASADGWSLGFSLAGGVAARVGEVDGSSVRYRDIRRGVDLVESIEGGSLKETIVLTELRRPGSLNRFRFPLTLAGLTPVEHVDGSIGFLDAGRVEVATMPEGVAFDASGDPALGTQAQTPVRLALVEADGGWAVEMTVDPDWLSSAARVAPISIDPNVVFDAGRDSAHSDAFVSQASPTTNFNSLLDSGSYVDKVGYGSYPTGQFNSFLQYEVSALAGHSIVSASWNGYFLSAAAYPSTYALTQASASWTDSTLTWNNQPGVTGTPATGSVTAAAQWATTDITGWVQGWVGTPSSNKGVRVDSNATNAYLRLASMEQASQDSYVAVTFANTAPAVPVLGDLAPTTGTSIMSLTPTLTSAAKTDADGDAVKYWFRLATSDDGETGQVVNSGWLTGPSYPVPAGTLQDGMTYSWKVYTWDSWGTAPTVGSPANMFRIDQRLGDQGAVMDSAGPVKVNLATGNVVTGVASPAFGTVGGPIGLSYSYNSQAPTPYGLSGAYYGECGTGASPTFPTEAVAVRQDTTVDFSWGTASPAAAMATDHFCVEWSGYLTVPTTATNWSIGATHDDGVRIYLNDDFTTPYVDQWVDGSGSHFGANLSLTANQAVPITIEYYDNTGAANVSLRVAGPSSIPVPSTWLSPSSPAALPQGWSLSAATSGGLMYTSVRVGNDSIVLLDQSGGTSEYQRSGGGGWEPVAGERAVVAQNPDGTFTVLGEDGVAYLFSTAGKLTSASSSGDDLNRAAAVYAYDGTTGKLASITDPVSSRALTLKYGTDAACATPPSGFDSTAPPGHLCGAVYPDGTKTSLFYSSGRLGRMVDPGNTTSGAADSPPVTDFVYDTNGRLTKVRDPFAADKVATNPTGLDNDTTRAVIAYDTGGRATGVTLPVPNAGETPALAAPGHSYRYVAGNETQLDVAGITPASGFARKVVFAPGSGLVEADTDATNRTSSTAWNSSELPIIATDPAGLRTTTVYNADDQPTDAYGPAPASCFSGQTPNGTCTSPVVPHASTAYDEGIKGLAGTYWPNIDQTGVPAYHSTGVGDITGALNVDWASGAPGGLPTDNWSARFTGEILIPQTGTYTFELDSNDGVRLMIDDSIVVDEWNDHSGFSASGVFANTVANSRHRVQVDYYDHLTGAKLGLYWTPPGGSRVLVPGANLFPAYRLATSSTDPDGKTTSTQYGAGAIGPEYGLATATIVDPGTSPHLNLTATTTYETPGTGSYLRRTARTLPKGSGSTVSYAYYTNTENPVTNTCGISAIGQAGMLKEVTQADPDGGGAEAAIKQRYVYDGLGRLAGTTTVGDSAWSCMTYDARRRVSSSVDRTGVAATLNYGTVGQVTESFTDSAGGARTTVAKVDLVGRPVTYTDEAGTTTRAVFDQAGRASAGYRTFAGQSEAQLTAGVYDDAGRPTSLTEYASGVGRITTFAYDTAGRSQTTTRPNGVITTATYDPSQGGLATLSHKQAGVTEVSPWTYTRNPSGTIATEATTGRTRAFTYDAAERLTTTNENSGATMRNYAFDANTNRVNAGYAYDAADRITASPAAGTYAYDPHGNLTASYLGTGPIFTDGFETGNLTAWTTTTASGGTATAQTTTVKTGTYAAQLSATSAAGSKAYVRRALPAPQRDVTMAGDVRVSTEGASGSNVPVFRFFDAAGTQLISLYRQNQDFNKLWVQHSGGYNLTTGTLPLNTWGRFELRTAAGNTVEVLLNGVVIYQTTTATLAAPITSAQLGQDTASQTFTLAADDITLSLGRFFTDGFETGNLTAWTATTASGGTATAQTTTVKTGTYAAQLSATSAAGSKAYVRRTLPTPQRDVTVAGDIRISTEGASGANVPIARLFDANGNRLASFYRQNQDANKLWVEHTGSHNLTTGTLPLNTWGRFELRATRAGPGADTIEAVLNGTVIYRTTTASLGARIASVQLGQDVASQAFTLAADDIAVTYSRLLTTITHDAHDHATVIDDGTQRVEETLAPSGRVLRRVVKDSTTGTTQEDTTIGYAGPGDSPAYERAGTGASPILLADDWTATNGSAWNTTKWTASTNSSARTVDVQGNQGRLSVNGDEPRVIATPAATTDAEVALTYKYSDRNATSTFRTTLRGSADWPLTSGYRLDIASNTTTVNLTKVVAGTPTTIGTFTHTADTNPQRLRFRTQGTALKVKIWAAGTPEPATWSLEITDSAITGTGKLQLQHTWTTGTRNIIIDDLTLANPAAARTTTHLGAGTTDTNGEPTYTHLNGHGDIAGSTDTTGAYTANPTTDEYGIGTTPTNRLGWLGGHQRSTTANNIIRMGVRLYDPSLGRFLAVDPVEGGSCNDYDYACADPVNNYDLSGTYPTRDRDVSDLPWYYRAGTVTPNSWIAPWSDWTRWYQSTGFLAPDGTVGLTEKSTRKSAYYYWQLVRLNGTGEAYFGRYIQVTQTWGRVRTCSASFGGFHGGTHGCTNAGHQKLNSAVKMVVGDLWLWEHGRWSNSPYPAHRARVN